MAARAVAIVEGRALPHPGEERDLLRAALEEMGRSWFARRVSEAAEAPAPPTVVAEPAPPAPRPSLPRLSRQQRREVYEFAMLSAERIRRGVASDAKCECETPTGDLSLWLCTTCYGDMRR